MPGNINSQFNALKALGGNLSLQSHLMDRLVSITKQSMGWVQEKLVSALEERKNRAGKLN